MKIGEYSKKKPIVCLADLIEGEICQCKSYSYYLKKEKEKKYGTYKFLFKKEIRLSHDEKTD